MAAILAVAVGLAYSNALHGAFVLDDTSSIRTNPSILHLWPLTGPLNPPGGGVTVQGRPLVNLSFALNYAFGGFAVVGYHLVNVLIHLAGALVLFGLVRRISGFGVGLAGAFLWALHPLQTEAVTYIVQRAESLMGLCYLATLYCFVRSVEKDEPNPSSWRRWSVVLCFLGMACKEVMVSAPLIVLLADRALFAGSFRQAWAERRGYYLGLFSSWILLGLLVIHTGSRGDTSGLGAGVPLLHYWVTQPPAICHYLGLAAWPSRLVFDYGTPWITHPLLFVRDYAFVAVAVGLVAYGLWRNAFVAFLGFWFFAVLAPTSLVPGNRQVLSEHRMYLALAPVMWLVALALFRLVGRQTWIAYAAVLIAAGSLGYATHARNPDYASPTLLYRDTALKLPTNPFNQANYGTALLETGHYWEAEPHLERALALLPSYPVAEDNLGSALVHMGRLEEAKRHFEKAIVEDPKLASARQNLGFELLHEGKTDEAIKQIKIGLTLEGDPSLGYDNLGSALASQGRIDEAIEAFRTSARIDPQSQNAHMNLGNALVAQGHINQGLAELETAIRLNPANGAAHFNRATVLDKDKRLPEAIAEFEVALQLEPRNAMVQQALGNAYLEAGRLPEAIDRLHEAVKLQPLRATGHFDLGMALLRIGDKEAAFIELRATLGLDPKFEDARRVLRLNGETP